MARVAFMGSSVTGLSILERITALVFPPHELIGIITPSDDRDERMARAEFEALAKRIDVPIVSARGGSDRTLLAWRPDIVFVVGWYRLIRLASLPTVPFYGFHYSPLPRYRGGAPVVWQIIRGEKEIGVTLFRLDDGVDDGDIVNQDRVPIDEDETIGEILPRLDRCAIGLLERSLSALLEGRATLRPQRHADASVFPRRKPDDGEIDWTRPAREVHDFVRAQSHPYPGAFSHVGRIRVWLWRTRVRDDWRPDQRPPIPGTIDTIEGDAAVISCGDGAISVIRAQREGEGEATGAAALSSVGARLGDA